MDQAMAVGAWELLEWVYDMSDISLCPICTHCSMLHHNCNCPPGSQKHLLLRLPAAMEALDACWGAASYPPRYRFMARPVDAIPAQFD